MRILILKTSVDITMKKLFKELGEYGDQEIDCLIQSSQIKNYQSKYPHVNFIDIKHERFECLSEKLTSKIYQKKYDQLYITLSGVHGYAFWNVLEFIDKVRFKEAFFYNCNGEKFRIPKSNMIKDLMGRLYIEWIDYVYR